MAKYGGKDVPFILVDGFNLLASKVFDVNVPEPEAVLEETTGVGDSWLEHLPVGLRKATMSQNGLFDDAADGQNAAFNEQQATSRIVCTGVEGNTIGKRFTGLQGAFGAKYTRAGSRGGLHKASVVYTLTGQVDEGVILQHLTAKTADWDTEGADSVDNGASSANGLVGYQHVTALSGFSGFVGKIRHSADDVTYADLITFANVTAAPAKERATAAGTVNRHLAYKGDVTGSGSLTPMCGAARG
ncbi:MAG: hypothetical protein Q8T13_04905 [Acidobacteriota bacterium]|nr:hypothetical protein [Acidobacteriota bacterium]